MKILGGNIMEYKVVKENKRGDKYVLKDDVLKNSKLSKESLDKLETYNILVTYDVLDYADDGTINMKCYLLSDVEKLENEDDDVEIWDDEFEDEDMEMSPEELEEDETIMKIMEERDKNDSGNRYTLEEILYAFLESKGKRNGLVVNGDVKTNE